MNRGVTLVEVLVALVIVVTTITVVSQGFSSAAQSLQVADRETRAAMLAEEKMCELETGEISLTQGESGDFDEPEGFSYAVESKASEIENLYEVTVTIQYPMGSENRSFQLSRLMRSRSEAP